MFDGLSSFRRVIVTGPHRSGTTIAAEMIAADTGKPCIREESFAFRDIIRAAAIDSGVIQGPYLLPWLPVLAGPHTAIVYMLRDGAEIDASVQRLREAGISTPLYSWQQGRALWAAMAPLLPHAQVVRYERLAQHPLWVQDRTGWGHRQTA